MANSTTFHGSVRVAVVVLVALVGVSCGGSRSSGLAASAVSVGSSSHPGDIARMASFDDLGRRHLDVASRWKVTPAVGCGAADAKLVDSMSYGIDPAASEEERNAAGDRVFDDLSKRGLVQAITCDAQPVFVERLPDADGYFAYYGDVDGRELLGFATTQWVTVDTDTLQKHYPG